MSRNLRLFAGAAIIFYLIAAMNDAAAVYVLSGICLAVIAGCYWLSRLAVAGLELEMRLPRAEVQAGVKVPVQIILRNIGIISRPQVIIQVPLHNRTIPGLTDTVDVLLPASTPGAVAEATIEIVLPARGRWEIGPAVLVGTDPLGMFHRPGPQSSPQLLLALPQVFDIPWMWRRELLSPAARLMAGARTRHGGEFWGIRQHEPGDDLRHVHWKVTAHRGDLVVKEYARGRELSASLWLDLSGVGVVGSGLHSSLEMSLSMAASIIPALLRMDQAVALVGQGLPPSLASPGRGEATAGRALRALAEVQAQNGRPFSALVAEQAREARPGLTGIVITSGIEPGLESALLAAAARGLALRCLLLAPGASLTPEQRARQEHLAARLRHVGVAVAVGANPGELSHVLSELADRQGLERAMAT
ncbi:DUF58 domain-containing protein [bacterium]|nr:DUF58 domain-containing protein [bacterium]